MSNRINNFFLKLEENKLDGLIVSSAANITYLTKYISRDSYLLVSRKGNIYFTDSRYVEEAGYQLKGIARVDKVNGSVFKLIAQACCELGLKRVGFEERILPYAEYKKIEENLACAAELIPTHGLIEELRQVKQPEEIKKIKQAVGITVQALKFIEKLIKPGKKEIEVAGELERFIRQKGASKASFEIIVASGPNSSLPHHLSSGRKIGKDEPVLVDMGVDYEGYKSDLTRVFLPSKINTLCQKVYDIVLEANKRAIEKANTAKLISEIDFAARGYIAQNGYAEFFGHSLGHGVGLEVHEEPHVSSKENTQVLTGMVFTIEPGIYLPGKFGIRIEDMVMISKKGAEVLSGAINK